MSLNDVWSKYDKERDTIQNHERYGAIPGSLSSVCLALAGFFKDDEITTTKLFIVSGGIFLFVIWYFLICSQKRRKLKAWLKQNYICTSSTCKFYFGDSSPQTLGNRCSNCGRLIDYSSRKSVTNLNLNTNRSVFASFFFCAFLTLALWGIGYFYPYSLFNININPNPAIQMLANDMVFVKGGSIDIGATEDQKPETDLFLDEHPDHNINVSNFYICKHEVTQALWKEVMGYNPSHHKGDKLPVDSVSYFDCMEFIKELNKISGQNYRLPTEEEWEYAARGGQKTKHTKYAGSWNIEDIAWYDKNSSKTTHEVCSKESNELGLYDMNGNVLEWCRSFYTKDYWTKEPSLSKEGDTLYVLRGGSFYSEAIRSRVAYRVKAERGLKKEGMGFRLVREFSSASDH